MNILFVNPTEEACGVYQFGKNTYGAIKTSEKYRFIYIEPYDDAALLSSISEHSPVAIVYNFYPCTMPWVSHPMLDFIRERGIKQISILHELDVTGFDYLLNPDPTFTDSGVRLRVGRPLLEFSGTYPVNDIVTIGSFGFGMGWKDYPHVVRRVNDEFEEAIINLQMPYAFWGDRDGNSARTIAAACRELVTKPGIQLNINHNFLPTDELLQFLAGNDLNAFLYPDSKGGISSCIDVALSVKRPIAITRTPMLRHIYGAKPSICVEETSLREILANGTKPLEEFYEKFSNDSLIKDYERVLDIIL